MVGTMGMVSGYKYIDYLILLIPTPLVYALFAAASLLFLFFYFSFTFLSLIRLIQNKFEPMFTLSMLTFNSYL